MKAEFKINNQETDAHEVKDIKEAMDIARQLITRTKSIQSIVISVNGEKITIERA